MTKQHIWAAAAVATLALAGAPAVAQKSGGILKMQHWDSPASMSIHEEATYSVVDPDDGRLQQSRALQAGRCPEQHAVHRPRPRRKLGLGRGRQGPDLQAAPRGQMARRQAVHRRRRQMHLRPAARKGRGQAPRQPAQGMVQQRRRGHRQRRFRGGLSPETAAAGVAGPARLGLFADLPLPRPAGADAAAPDRHRAVQVRRVQAQRIHQGDQEPGLLEAGPALSRRHRVRHHPQPLDRDPRVYRRAVRRHLALQRHPAFGARHRQAGAERDLRAGDQ